MLITLESTLSSDPHARTQLYLIPFYPLDSDVRLIT